MQVFTAWSKCRTYVESGGVSSLRLRSGMTDCREELAHELSRTRRGRAIEAFAARYLVE